LAYASIIEGTPFYFSRCSLWQPYGVQLGFTNDGQPSPYGPGSFTATVRAMAVDPTNPADYGGDFATSGTFQQLLALIYATFPTGYVQTYEILDPRTNTFTSVLGRLDLSALLNSLAGGAALEDVSVVVTGAFIPSGVIGTYYGGDPDPILTATPYIAGDPLPPTDPDRTYGYGLGGYGHGLYGQGEGV
jgi:hypothetical protein